MKYIIQEFIKIQYGEKNKTTNQRTGHYTVTDADGRKQEFTCLKNLIKHNINQNSIQQLENIRNHIGTVTDPNLESGSGSKHLMRTLIAEWAQKNNKANSILVQWSHLNEGQDRQEFRKKLTTLKMVDAYCTELVDFLLTLIRSCPKAEKLYNEKYPKH